MSPHQLITVSHRNRECLPRATTVELKLIRFTSFFSAASHFLPKCQEIFIPCHLAVAKLNWRRTINNMIIRCSIITCLCWCCYIRYITTATSLICVQKPMNEEKSSVRSWCWCWLTGDVRKLTVFTKSFYAAQRRNCSTIKKHRTIHAGGGGESMKASKSQSVGQLRSILLVVNGCVEATMRLCNNSSFY